MSAKSIYYMTYNASINGVFTLWVEDLDISLLLRFLEEQVFIWQGRVFFYPS